MIIPCMLMARPLAPPPQSCDTFVVVGAGGLPATNTRETVGGMQ